MTTPRRNSYDLRHAHAGLSPVGDHEDRACAQPDVDPEIFFPDRANGGRADYGDARAICGRCPHTAACLDWALTTRQDHGMWGMTTPEERRALIKRAEIENGVQAA